MRILMTGFVPFGGDSVNASQLAVQGCLAPEGVQLHKLILPVVFGEAVNMACRAIDQLKPDVIICVGEAGGRKAVTPERVGINVMDARIADNNSYQPEDVKIAEGGPDAYFSTLPIKKMVAAMTAAGFDAQISNTAGTFVCNNLMYGVLHYINTRYAVEGSAAALNPEGTSSDVAGSSSAAEAELISPDAADSNSAADADLTSADVADSNSATAADSNCATTADSKNAATGNINPDKINHTCATPYRPLAGFIHVPADRPVTNPDGTVTPVPGTSAKALTAALTVFA